MKEFAKEQFARALAWPAQSPDLGPLDYATNDYVKHEVRKRAAGAALPEAVRAAISSTMEEMPREYVEKMVDSFPKRLRGAGW